MLATTGNHRSSLFALANLACVALFACPLTATAQYQDGTTVTIVNDTRYSAQMYRVSPDGQQRLVGVYKPGQQTTAKLPGNTIWVYKFDMGPFASGSGSFSVAAFGVQKVFLSGAKPQLKLPQPTPFGVPGNLEKPVPEVPEVRKASPFEGVWKGTWVRKYYHEGLQSRVQEHGTTEVEFKANGRYAIVELNRFGKLDHVENGAWDSVGNASLDLIFRGQRIQGTVKWTGPTSIVWTFRNLNGIDYELTLDR